MLVELENSYKGNLNELCHGTFSVFRPKLTLTRGGRIKILERVILKSCMIQA